MNVHSGRLALQALILVAIVVNAARPVKAVTVSTSTLAQETAGLPRDSKIVGPLSNPTTISSNIKSDVTKAHATAFASSKINTTTGVITKSTSGSAYYNTGSPTFDAKLASWSASASGTTLVAHSITATAPSLAPFRLSLFTDPNQETGFDATFSNALGGAAAPKQELVRDNGGLTTLPAGLDVVLSLNVVLNQPPFVTNQTLFNGTATFHPDGKVDFTNSFFTMGVQAIVGADSANPGAQRTHLSDIAPINFNVKPDVPFDLLLDLGLSMGNPLDPNPALQTIGSSLARNLGVAAAFSTDTSLTDTTNFALQVVPEPSSVLLLVAGALGSLLTFRQCSARN